MEFFRRCPSCGRRFVVKVDREVLVSKEDDTVKMTHDLAMPRVSMGGGAMMPVAAVTIDVPIERDTFEVTYECKHCHHVWKETLVVAKKEGLGKNDSITRAWPYDYLPESLEGHGCLHCTLAQNASSMPSSKGPAAGTPTSASGLT